MRIKNINDNLGFIYAFNIKNKKLYGQKMLKFLLDLA